MNLVSILRAWLLVATVMAATDGAAQTAAPRQPAPAKPQAQPEPRRGEVNISASPMPTQPGVPPRKLEFPAPASGGLPSAGMQPSAPAGAQSGISWSAVTNMMPIGVQVSAKASATIAAPMSGQLIAFPAADGDSIKENDVVARFNCAQQEAVLARAQAEMVKRQDILGMQHSLRALQAYSKAELVNAQNDVAVAKAELQLAQTTADNCVVKAPFAGRIANAPVRNFQFVQAGAPLVDIVDDRDLELEFIVPSTWLVWLKAGAPAQVQISETNGAFAAEVTRISGKVDAASQTIKIYGRITGNTSSLLPGMSGLAFFPGSVSQTPN